jgi:hypothetical protein
MQRVLPEFIEVPLLSPELLNYAKKGEQLLRDATQWGFRDCSTPWIFS